MHEQASLLADSYFWYTLSVVIFFAGAYHYGRKPILAWLDAEIAKVRLELEEARKLRDEAAAVLEDYRARQRAALQEAADIVSSAKKEAERLREEAKADLKATLVRYENKAESRIRMAEAEAIAEVRAVVIEQALETARRALATKADDTVKEQAVKTAIAEVSRLTS